MPVLVIIPAAGSGSRFGGPIPKQFQPLAGKPLVQYVVERFLMTDAARIVVAIPEALLTTVKQAAGDNPGPDGPTLGHPWAAKTIACTLLIVLWPR